MSFPIPPSRKQRLPPGDPKAVDKARPNRTQPFRDFLVPTGASASARLRRGAEQSAWPQPRAGLKRRVARCRFPVAAPLARQACPRSQRWGADFAVRWRPVPASLYSVRAAAALAGSRGWPTLEIALRPVLHRKPTLARVFRCQTLVPHAAPVPPRGRCFWAVDRSSSPPRIHFSTEHESTKGMSLGRRTMPAYVFRSQRAQHRLTVHCSRVRSKYGERVNGATAASPATGEIRARHWCRRNRTSSTAPN